MDAQTVAEQMPQNLDGQTRQTEGRTNLHQAKAGGRSEAEPTPVSPPLGLTSGEALAYSMGKQAAKDKSLANPQFSTYAERIWYRAGWLEEMKHNT